MDLSLVWIGAPGGQAWKQHPLRLAFEKGRIVRSGVLAALNAPEVAWPMGVESDSSRTIEASVSADVAGHTVLAASAPLHAQRIVHAGALPNFARSEINLYVADHAHSPAVIALPDLIRSAAAG